MKLTDTFVAGNTIIEIALADITTSNVEVVVNSICNLLHVGTGVSGAILVKGGYEILDEFPQPGQVAVSEVFVTTAGDLPFKYVFHAISSICEEGTNGIILKNSVINSLNEARKKNIKTLAFPALGTGQMGFDVHEAAKILIDTVVDDCISIGGIDRILFCLLHPDAFTSFFRETVKQSVKREILGKQKDMGENEGEKILSKLSRCQLGKQGWQNYEELSIKLFKFLFVPPLSEPRIQSRTENGLHVRDAIFPNFAEDGFWNTLDRRYKASMIVVECKNYAEPIGQNALNQMGKYLKGDALGKLGFIATRKEPSKEAKEARKEIFRDLNAIIIFIDDFDFSQMVDLKRVNSNPEEYIQRKIEDFLIGY